MREKLSIFKIFSSNNSHKFIFINHIFFVCESDAGGLFDGITEDAKNAFQYAVDVVNSKKGGKFKGKFEAVAETVEFGNEFEASKSLCKILKVSSGSWRSLVLSLDPH